MCFIDLGYLLSSSSHRVDVHYDLPRVCVWDACFLIGTTKGHPQAWLEEGGQGTENFVIVNSVGDFYIDARNVHTNFSPAAQARNNDRTQIAIFDLTCAQMAPQEGLKI